MANGFIILKDKSIFIIRWTGYDEIIRIAINELKEVNSESQLALWLSKIVPSSYSPKDENQWGTGFINPQTNEMFIGKELDLRGLTEENQILFEKALKSGYSKLIKNGQNYSFLNPDRLNDLLSKIQYSHLKKNPLEHSNSKSLAHNHFEKIGPGWNKN